MAISIDSIQTLQNYLSGVLDRAEHHAGFAAQQAGEAVVGYYSGAIGEEVRKYAEENTGYAIDPMIWKLMLPF